MTDKADQQPQQQQVEGHVPCEEDVLEAIFNPNMPFGSATQEPELHGPADAKEDTEEEKRMREKERAAIKLAEDQKLDEALAAFSELIKENPSRAAGYNDRAQVYQMKGDKDSAMKDLDYAIEKCELSTKVAQQVYAQRGVLKRLNGDTEGARKDFETAGMYGNAWARHEAVKLNPYAALCNQMLKQAVDKLSGKAPEAQAAATKGQNGDHTTSTPSS
ncbi:tetratricopeptide repeat protein 36 [Salpingoeca rosetta]|uniref:Tetratricopeptide repeat protein 36 n=1 Tax=Salpingoeca rosetta (strain ATCC 50818 / BSB-021) TaxID=946362 RepID=F2U7M0_SALR5|nr:tetratricopeptide repeat protein 36 [Salpingoeca rosetta]EGD83437.1 tetratricopeptide repeat protein 36 [Salpingoeca rosetta]|eukprot:XP_004994941.1 tetratricopeptide repeat protein 36 [Salpingoeca rosetta]